MFNLIPANLKEEILSDYRWRRVILILEALLVIVFMSCIFILPSYVYLTLEEKSLSQDSEAIKSSVLFNEADLIKDEIKEINEQLRALSIKKNSIEPLEYIEKLISIKKSSIHLDEIEYKELTATTSSLTVKGVADKRESLRQFITNLESVKGFSKVILPVSNFAKDRDIDFIVNINLI